MRDAHSDGGGGFRRGKCGRNGGSEQAQAEQKVKEQTAAYIPSGFFSNWTVSLGATQNFMLEIEPVSGGDHFAWKGEMMIPSVNPEFTAS